MRKIDRLRKEAIDSAEWRGHKLSRFKHHKPGTVIGKVIAHANCIICRKWVTIETQPMPNSIDIGGPAIAIGCND